MFQYIRQHHLFALFTSYSLQNIRTNSHAHIHFLQIRLEANIRKTLGEFPSQANFH